MKALAPSRLFTLAVLLCCCGWLSGCGLVKSKQDADKILTKHFEAISTNAFNTALADYGSQFFQTTSKEEWSKVLARLTAKLGTYQNHTITGWRSFSNIGSFGSGTTVAVQCQVNYSKHSAQESFTLFKGVTDSTLTIR